MTDQLTKDLASLRIDRGGARPPRRALKVLVGLGLAAVTAWAAITYGKPYVEAQVFRATVSVTEIGSLSPAQAAVELAATGYVVPQSTAKVGSKIIGTIIEAHIIEGQAVKAGDVLFKLDPDDQNAAVRTAQAQVAAAQSRVATARAQKAEAELQYKRQKPLADEGALPRAEVDDLAARLDSLNAQIKAAEAEVVASQAQAQNLATGLDNLVIVAPIDGTALDKPKAVGDVAFPELPLVELADFSTLLVEADVAEARLSLVKPGAPCEIVLDALPSERLPGEVVGISPRLNRSKATAVVKVRFKNPPEQLRPDMNARVSFLEKALDEAALKEAPKTIVPANALVDVGGGKAVWVVEGETVRRVPIELGESLGAGFVVERGPPPGTRVVKDPPADLFEGQKIKEQGSS